MSWEVFYMNMTNNSSKLTLDETISMDVLSEVPQRKSMGLSIEDLIEDHSFGQTTTNGQVRAMKTSQTAEHDWGREEEI